MEAEITALLRDSDLNVASRIHWVRRPQSETAFPTVVLTRISGRRDYSLTGGTGLVESRLQVDVYGLTYGSAKTASNEIANILSGYRSENLRAVFLDTERDLGDADPGDVNPLFRVSTDYQIWHI